MMMKPYLTAALLLAAAAPAQAQRVPPPGTDADTKAWWSLTATLAGDDMQGRDTGSADYERAAAKVAADFKAAGLQPAGEAGGWLQRVPMHEVRVPKAGTRFAIVAPGGARTPLAFLHDISVRATAELPAKIEAALVFRGYCGKADIGVDVAGKIVVCFGGRRHGMPGAGERLAAAAAAGALGIINIDDVGFTLEPPRWPDAYSRGIEIDGAPPPEAPALAVLRFNASKLGVLLAGSGHSAAEIVAAATAAKPLPSFDLATRLSASLARSQRAFSNSNVLALLPGSDPAKLAEIVVISAHLDGYGHGEPVKGDGLYNGTLDDAAYVATLIRLAQRRHGADFARPLLFAVFTGEEKGLLGSRWFTAHPTVPAANLAADINLDAVRPIFPLKILTMIHLENSSLAANVQAVAAPRGITIRPDREPERGMNRRTDASPFLTIGVPAFSFMFGYDPGTPSEAIYRDWYRNRYHKPQDDLDQPIDFKAASDFNHFIYALTANIADAPQRPMLR